jgi:hypothetical protein
VEQFTIQTVLSTPAVTVMDVLDRDLLRALAAMAIEGFQQCRVGPRELVRLMHTTFRGLYATKAAKKPLVAKFKSG